MAQFFDKVFQLPLRLKVAWLGAGLLLAGVLLSQWQSYVSRTPEYAFRTVQRIETSEDIASCRSYLTAQGAKVVTYGIQNSRGPNTDPKMIYQQHQIRGTSCYFPFTQGTDTAGYLEFKWEGVWKFHDMVLTRYRGRDVEFSVAYYIDHPFLASLQVTDWTTLAESFLNGFMLGFGVAR